MNLDRLEPVVDVSVGDWIAAHISEFGSRVCDVVPTLFDAYARVLHPAQDEQGHPVTWAKACQRTGQTLHATMLWSSIAPTITETRTTGRWPFRQTVRSSTATWHGREPAEGNIPTSTVVALLDALDRFTPAGSDCYHAVWDGWSWLNADAMQLQRRTLRGGPAAPAVPPSGVLPQPVLAGPRFSLPGRDYLLFRAPCGHRSASACRSPTGARSGSHPTCCGPPIAPGS